MVRRLAFSAVFFAASVAALSAGPALAMAHLEAHRRSARVDYEDGTWVSLNCEIVDRCAISVFDGDREWHVAHAGLDRLVLLPYELALFDYPEPGKFIVHTEVACVEYAEKPPTWKCLVGLVFEEGRLVDTNVWKEASDDEYGVEPFRLPADAAAAPEAP